MIFNKFFMNRIQYLFFIILYLKVYFFKSLIVITIEVYEFQVLINKNKKTLQWSYNVIASKLQCDQLQTTKISFIKIRVLLLFKSNYENYNLMKSLTKLGRESENTIVEQFQLNFKAWNPFHFSAVSVLTLSYPSFNVAIFGKVSECFVIVEIF